MKHILIDRTAQAQLLLPDGRKADGLRLTELRRALERLEIPGIASEMGKAALLDCYAEHLAAVAAQAPGVVKRRKVSSAVYGSQAVVASDAGGN